MNKELIKPHISEFYFENKIHPFEIGFYHEKLNKENHYIYFDSHTFEFVIIFYFNFKVYESIIKIKDSTFNINNFKFYFKKKYYIYSELKKEENESIYNLIYDITFNFSNHLINHTEFKLPILLKLDLGQVFLKFIDKKRKEELHER